MIIFGKEFNSIKIIGNPEVFSLEERIFNAVCLLAFIAMFFGAPLNYFIGLYITAIFSFIASLIAAFLYYISRFKRKSIIGIMLFCISCNLLFALNYFFNSGIFGPNLLAFSVGFLLIIAILPKKHLKLWISINIIIVLTILTIEYFNPQLAPNSFKSEISKTLDFAITYLVVIFLIYFTISYIKDNYEYERNLVIEKNQAIEKQNNAIQNQNLILERLNKEKDKLFSIVTHDIRTPLNSIQGYLEHLDNSDITDEEKNNFKQQLLEMTIGTSTMLTNLLSWSKTQLNGTKANLVSLDIKDTLSKSLNIEKNLAFKKGIQLVFNIDESLKIHADLNMFELVVRNLINNAIKFTKVGGLIEISASRKIKTCLITVKDNGIGMNAKLQSTLFKFAASATYGTNNEQGIGIGLLLCKEYTDLQDGSIWFESLDGYGSTFYLSFKTVN